MAETIATWLVTLAGAYFGIGLLFALVFVTVGVGRLDPSAREGTWGFRLLIVPGVAALWPLLARRWLRGEGTPVEKNPHRDGAS